MAQMQHQILLAHLVPAVIKFLAKKQRWLQCHAEVFLPNVGCPSHTLWYRVLYVSWLHLPLNKIAFARCGCERGHNSDAYTNGWHK